MRISPGQVAGVLRNPGAYSVLLLYGDDYGQVRERAIEAARSALGGEDDPFRQGILAREEHGQILQEARSLPLSGGRRVVRVLDANDALSLSLARLGEQEGGALLILEAGALPAKSKLRALAENRSDWAAIGCYPATAAVIASEIRSAVQEAGGTIQPQTLQTLAAVLPADTGSRRSEMNKLLTFAGPGGEIDDAAVESLCTDVAEISFAALFDAVLRGDVSAASDLAQRAVDDGATGPGLITALGFHLHRILKLRLLVDGGLSPEAACGKLFPPVFPRQAGALVAQLRYWSASQLGSLLAELRIADQACKRAASRDDTIACYLMLNTARRAARANRAD